MLAGDLPLVTSASLSRLLHSLDRAPRSHAAAALDERGLPNPLLAAYRVNALRRASACALGPGSPAAHLLPEETLTVAFDDQETLNVNRPADLLRAEALLSSLLTVNRG